MKRLLTLVTLIFSFQVLFSQNITSDSLISQFLSGKLFIFNSYALNTADSSFFIKAIQGSVNESELMDKVTGKNQYGTIGENGVFKIVVNNLDVFKDEEYVVVDSSVLKYFDQDRPMLYFIDGIPNTNIYAALGGLINKEIKEIKELDSNRAKGIWGNQGANGAIIINTDGKLNLPMK